MQSRKQISPEIAFSVTENHFHSKLGSEFGDFEFFKFSDENS